MKQIIFLIYFLLSLSCLYAQIKTKHPIEPVQQTPGNLEIARADLAVDRVDVILLDSLGPYRGRFSYTAVIKNKGRAFYKAISSIHRATIAMAIHDGSEWKAPFYSIKLDSLHPDDSFIVRTTGIWESNRLAIETSLKHAMRVRLFARYRSGLSEYYDNTDNEIIIPASRFRQLLLNKK
jgi:hypothetical protein